MTEPSPELVHELAVEFNMLLQQQPAYLEKGEPYPDVLWNLVEAANHARFTWLMLRLQQIEQNKPHTEVFPNATSFDSPGQLDR